MNALGSFQLTWTNGYKGSSAEYINQDVICYKCGDTLEFISGDGQKSMYVAPPGESIGPLAVHGINKLFAYSENAIKPKIYVFHYPAFLKIATLQDDAQLEYLLINFSSSDYLASISGVPDYKLVIWRYTDGTKLCTQELAQVKPNCVSFNPSNWRQLAIATAKELTIWNIEQCNVKFMLKKQKVKLPVEKNRGNPEEATSRNSSKRSRANFKLPISAIAGVMGDGVLKFEDYKDEVDRMIPVNLCWLPSGDVVVGCSGGQLIKVDVENSILTVLSFLGHGTDPNSERSSKDIAVGSKGHISSPVSPVVSSVSLFEKSHSQDGIKLSETKAGFEAIHEEEVSKEKKDKDRLGRSYSTGEKSQHQDSKAHIDDDKEESRKDMMNKMPPGSLNCMKMHRKGLFVAGSDGVLRVLQLEKDSFFIVEQERIEVPVTSMSFDPTHHMLALGSNRGSIHLIDPDNISSSQLLFDIHYGNFLAVCAVTGTSDYCVTLRESGCVQVWNSENGDLVGALSIGVKACSLATSPMVHMAVVGSQTGYAYIVDLNKLDELRVVYSIHLHQTPIRSVVFNEVGQLFLTGSTDGHVFVIDGRPSKQFEPVGYVKCPGDVKCIATFMKNGETKVVVTTDVSDAQSLKSPANKFYSFNLPSDLLQDPKSKHASVECNFKDEVINRLCFDFPEPVFGIAFTDDDTIFSLNQVNKMLQKFQVPKEAVKKERNKDPILVVTEQMSGHQLPGGCIAVSPRRKWLASGGGDGQLAIRAIDKMESPIVVWAHNYWRGGVLNCCFSFDAQLIFSTGYDGTLRCFKWNGQPMGKMEIDEAASLMATLHEEQVKEDKLLVQMSVWLQKEPEPSTDKDQKANDVEKEIEKAIEDDLIYTPASPVPPEDATWHDIKRIEAQKEEEKKYANEKLQLRTEIREMRRKLLQMMKDNETVPDIEKLPKHEFDLDVEEQKRLQDECEVEVQKLREEKEYQNIAKLYLTEMIRTECWDDMFVKGRGIVSFNTGLEVHNYPMKERTKQELKELEIVQAQRRVEIAELQARKEIADAMNKASKDMANVEDEPVDTEELKMQVLREKSAILGSLGFEVGGDSDLFYSQFELATREQKQKQIILLQDAIYRIRMKFNKDFDDVLLKKNQEILKIKEKNKRIRKIMDDLGLTDEVYEPELGLIEKPEMLLITNDDEVKVEKYLTPEQWKKMEEDKKNEEERRLRERGDNWRERGLDQMMGGVLEIKKEDELKKDIPIPAFMQEKKEEEWNEEERKAADEYKQKVKELEEERDKFRKQLELELRKLQSVVQEGTQAFDELHYQLFMKKIKTESVILQEELKIMRLRYSLLTEEEFMNYEKELLHDLENAKLSVQLATSAYSQAKKDLDDYRNEYDIHVADDKVHERMFRREFQNIPNQQIDQLFRHYKKRPRGQKGKTVEPQTYESSNPFADRPSTAKRNEEARYALNQAMAELNHEKNIPEGVDNETWEHLCAYRMEKIEKELQVKQEALTLAEMQAFVQNRHEEEEKLKSEMEDVIDNLNKLREARQLFYTDLEVQLLLKQGQVEVDPGPFLPNYKTTLLIHREVVEELNKKIRQLGESKIASMVESKDFRKGIVVLEWEHKKMRMEMEDLKNLMRDIVNMKVTREIQAYLSCEDYDALKNQEIATLEQTIALQKKHHESRVLEKKKALKVVKQSVVQMMEKNTELESELEQLNVTVNERRHIHDVNPEKFNDMDREQRYKEIVQRRKLIDLAKAQAQEIAMLRTELERLRMRTFPALVQSDH